MSHVASTKFAERYSNLIIVICWSGPIVSGRRQFIYFACLCKMFKISIVQLNIILQNKANKSNQYYCYLFHLLALLYFHPSLLLCDTIWINGGISRDRAIIQLLIVHLCLYQPCLCSVNTRIILCITMRGSFINTIWTHVWWWHVCIVYVCSDKFVHAHVIFVVYLRRVEQMRILIVCPGVN